MKIRLHPLTGLLISALLLSLLWPVQASSQTSCWDSLSTSLGFTTIDPGLSSNPVRAIPDANDPDNVIELEDTVQDRGSSTRPSLTLTWRLPIFDGNWSVETVLGPPFRFSFEFTGGNDLSNEIDGKLGETDMLPPVLMLVYNFPLSTAVRPYLGAGGSYLYSFNSELTAEETAEGDLDIENVATWLIQAGANIDLDWLGWSENLFLNLDVKYIDSVRPMATISDLESQGTTIDRTEVRLKLEPWAFSAGLGWRF